MSAMSASGFLRWSSVPNFSSTCAILSSPLLELASSAAIFMRWMYCTRFSTSALVTSLNTCNCVSKYSGYPSLSSTCSGASLNSGLRNWTHCRRSTSATLMRSPSIFRMAGKSSVPCSMKQCIWTSELSLKVSAWLRCSRKALSVRTRLVIFTTLGPSCPSFLIGWMMHMSRCPTSLALTKYAAEVACLRGIHGLYSPTIPGLNLSLSWSSRLV
mmetsp:Transcript_26849/g.58523  ORF Transcript_26849/g.58523 Transcript_26849/m.58523 type:complete len:214 (-) Transcript_26849:2022-2663(-)